MKKRHLSGIYFRVKRDGKWGSVDFLDLTRKERIEIMNRMDIDCLKKMCLHISSSFRSIAEQFDIRIRIGGEEDE